MTTRVDVMNSRLLDVHRWSEHSNVANAITALMEELKLSNRRYAACLHVLLLNLYLIWRLEPTMYVAYSRDEKSYGKGGRFHCTRFSYDVMMRTVDGLIARDYIENVQGGQFVWDEVLEERYAMTSRMRATRRLIRLVVRHRIKLGMIGRSVDDVIVLRSEPEEVKKGRKTIKKKREVEFDTEPQHVTHSRLKLQAYNDLLQRAYIDVDDEHLTTDESKEIRQYDLDLTRKRVYRIFSNGKWDEGGRFYRAWWMECPKILRKYIVINGDYTVELDYSGIHINLLYAMKQINYAEKDEDPYILDGYPHRKLNKLVLLTAINAKDDRSTVLGVWDQLREDGKAMPYGLKSHEVLYQIIAALKAKHNPIEDMIASGEGVRLQYLDSQIAEHVMDYFTQRNIPILTVHDSFICSALVEPVLMDIMKTAFVSVINKYLELDYKSPMEELRYDEEPVTTKQLGDIIVNVERQSISEAHYNTVKRIPVTMYKQGRRFNRYRLTGSTDTIARVTNIER